MDCCHIGGIISAQGPDTGTLNGAPKSVFVDSSAREFRLLYAPASGSVFVYAPARGDKLCVRRDFFYVIGSLLRLAVAPELEESIEIVSILHCRSPEFLLLGKQPRLGVNPFGNVP